MNHWRAVSVPTMMMRGPRPFHRPPMPPNRLYASPIVRPFSLFNLETIVSATKRQKTTINYLIRFREDLLRVCECVLFFTRMADYGTEDTGDVAGAECDGELLAFGALLARLGHHMLVDQLDGSLEARELHHRVRNLTSPQWTDALVETWNTINRKQH